MWHPQHFTCCHCNDEIGHKNFFERSGKAYCENDYHDLFSPRCGYCNGPIKERCINAMGRQFHPEHFVCAECGKSFGDDGFHEKNGHALCKEDFFRLYAPKCKGCDQAITSKFITALQTHWHPECFVCNVSLF
jgi:paxillin